jgi:hypothetical protein
MRVKINWGFVLLAWLIIEMVGIILITPGPLINLAIDAMVFFK